MKRLAVAAGAAALVAFGAGTGWVAGRFSGGAYIDSTLATDYMEVEGTRVQIARTAVVVPAAFGELKGVGSRKGGGSVLWFEADGVLRNVEVPDGTVVVRREGTLVR